MQKDKDEIQASIRVVEKKVDQIYIGGGVLAGFISACFAAWRLYIFSSK